MIERIKVEPHIYIRVEGGKTLHKPFELAKVKTYRSLNMATKVFKEVLKVASNTYLYETKNGFMVDVKMVYADLEVARRTKDCLMEIMEGAK